MNNCMKKKFTLISFKGDSPIHTYFLITMLDKNYIHLFRNVFYGHQFTKNYQHSFLLVDFVRCRPLKNDCNQKWTQISNFY